MKRINKRRTVDDELYAHFLTFSVYRRRKLLDHDHPQGILLCVFNELCYKQSIENGVPPVGLLVDARCE
jgi:hypothetical protein